MVEENKNEREEDSINLFLEQALMRQRDEMMEDLFHVLQCLSITTCEYSSRGHFGGTFSLKVQFSFDILLFEG
jgi:hypothetical protein